MKREIIKELNKNGLVFASDYKIHDLSGGYIGINYNKEKERFGIFAKRNIYYYTKEEINSIKKELDEKFELISKLNSMLINNK